MSRFSSNVFRFQVELERTYLSGEEERSARVSALSDKLAAAKSTSEAACLEAKIKHLEGSFRAMNVKLRQELVRFTVCSSTPPCTIESIITFFFFFFFFFY